MVFALKKNVEDEGRNRDIHFSFNQHESVPQLKIFIILYLVFIIEITLESVLMTV